MQDFINIMGKDNIFIICLIIVVIILALLVIIIIEKVSSRKYRVKKNIEIETYKENLSNNDLNSEKESIIFNNNEINNSLKEKEIVYTSNEKTEEDAKKELEEAAKKLVYEEKNDLIGPTFFEKVQEEKSIISYDELIKANLNPDELDSYIKEDEGNEPITLEELYKNNANEDLNETEEVSLKSQTEEVKEIKKFKNSSIISPVFGIKNENEKVNIYQTSNVKNIEDEIQKTEEILDELKKLKERIEK